MSETAITIKFINAKRTYTKESAKRFLVGRFMKTENPFYLEKLKDLVSGVKYIDLEGN